MIKVKYSRRAIADIQSIANESFAFGEKAAVLLKTRIDKMLRQIAELPKSAPRVANESDIHAISLGQFPYKIFYQIIGNTILILTVRHTSRSDWSENLK